jgi:MoaA/NifB/PqqE/SkfB family radical SAM enzyme
MVEKNKAQRLAQTHRLPEFVMVENTSACNLRCVSCPREQIRQLRCKTSMSPEDVRNVATELKQAGIKRVAYLNLGEPFLSKTIRQELELIRQINPGIWINTSTNATLIDTDDKREAALLIDKMEVSLDGFSQETAGRYQRGLDFDRAYRNMKVLAEYRDAKGSRRPQIVWKYLLFRWNDRRRYLHRAIEMARQAKVDAILFEKTVSPLHGVSLRSRLGLHKGIGEEVAGGRLVALR